MQSVRFSAQCLWVETGSANPRRRGSAVAGPQLLVKLTNNTGRHPHTGPGTSSPPRPGLQGPRIRVVTSIQHGGPILVAARVGGAERLPPSTYVLRRRGRAGKANGVLFLIVRDGQGTAGNIFITRGLPRPEAARFAPFSTSSKRSPRDGARPAYSWGTRRVQRAPYPK